MRILVISYRIPYPLTAGFRIRIYNEAKYLKSVGYHVDLIFLGKREDLDEFGEQLYQVFDNVKQFSINKGEVIRNLFELTILKKKPFQVSLYWNKKMNDYIQSIESNYDVIIGNAVRNAEYLFNLPQEKTVLDMHDAISYNYQNLIKNLWGPKKLFYYIERKMLMEYECDITKKLKRIIIISEEDRLYLSKIGANISNITVIPVAVRDDIQDRKINVANDECAVCFLGKMSYQPNADAVIWFAKSVFPKLKKKYKELKFYILGIEPSKDIKALEGNGIIVTGFVENPYKVVSNCMAMVVPIRNGAGMQNKILESMVVGTPCVVSSIAAEGLNGVNGTTYIIADTVEEYLDELDRLIANSEKRKKLSRNGTAFVARYTWDNMRALFIEVLNKKVAY